MLTLAIKQCGASVCVWVEQFLAVYMWALMLTGTECELELCVWAAKLLEIEVYYSEMNYIDQY